MQFNASAPGSLMLLGEYAVLHGKPALVCAVDKRIHVALTPRRDTGITITSDLHGRYETDLLQLKIEKPYQFVLGALKHYQAKLKRGCDITITADFSDQIGFGSSAAVTVATLAAIITWLDIRMSPIDLIRHGRNVVRAVQGVGSGADIAAAVYGGVVAYQAQPLTAERFAVTHPITAIYSGFKTKTADAIKKVHDYFAPYPDLFRNIMNSIGQCAIDGVQAVRKENWQQLGAIMTMQQGLMESLGVSLPLLRDITSSLHAQQTILGAKISGSGLGDCVIGLGALPQAGYQAANIQHIPIAMTLQGVQCEKI